MEQYVIKDFLYKENKTLWFELEKNGFGNRLKEISQLGELKKKTGYTKYDYVLVQLYLHDLIKRNLSNEIIMSYNSEMKIGNKKITIGAILQILTILGSIGHFYNAFVSSQALLEAIMNSDSLRQKILNDLKEERWKNVFLSMLEKRDYFHINHINALFILNHCDQNKEVVKIAKEILYKYLINTNEDKWDTIFTIFKNIRNLSFVITDLPMSNIPFLFDTVFVKDKEKDILFLCKELFAKYKDKSPAILLINSFKNLLDRNLYNEENESIRNFQIINQMSYLLEKENVVDYYEEIFLNKDSILNRTYDKEKFDMKNILKITFENTYFSGSNKEFYKNDFISLKEKLEKIKGIKISIYDRYNGDKTILILLEEHYLDKIYISFEILKIICSFLIEWKIYNNDDRYLLVTKFFLYYLFEERECTIQSNLEDFHVLYLHNKQQILKTIKEIQNICNEKLYKEKPKQKEIDFSLEVLEENKKHSCIFIPSSIKIKNGKQIYAEIDGMLIDLKTNETIFIEAKKTKKRKSLAENDLKEKIVKIKLMQRLNIKEENLRFVTKKRSSYLKVKLY